MADLSLSVVVSIVDYPPRLDGPAGDTLAATLSDVATAFVCATAQGYDAHHDDAHSAADLEDHVIACLERAKAEPTDVGYRLRLVQSAAITVAAIQRWDRLHPLPTATPDPETV